MKVTSLSKLSKSIILTTIFLVFSIISVSAQTIRLQSVWTGSYQLSRSEPGPGSKAIVPKPYILASQAAFESFLKSIPRTLPNSERRGGAREENLDPVFEAELDFGKLFAVVIVQDESRLGPLRFDSVHLQGKTVSLKTSTLNRGPESREVDLGFYTLLIFNRLKNMDNILAYENKILAINEYRYFEEDEQSGLYGLKSNSKDGWIVKPVWPMASEFDEWNHASVYIQGRGFFLVDWDGKPLFEIFNFDNGPDYFSEGLARYLDDKKKMGYFDLSGNIVIKAAWDFVLPFEDGQATVIVGGMMKQENEHSFWSGGKKSQINNVGQVLK